MTQETKSPDVSYVTESQRLWIDREYGSGWDQLKIKAIDCPDCVCISESEEITTDVLIERINYAIASVPEEHRADAVLKLSARTEIAYFTARYRRLETEREFNRRIASYLHRWGKMRDMYEKQIALFRRT